MDGRVSHEIGPEWNGGSAAWIGVDERRSPTRAWRDWEALRGALDLPVFDEAAAARFRDPRSLTVELDGADPRLVHVGMTLAADCGGGRLERAADLPQGSLPALLAAHWEHVVRSRAPVAFEGEITGRALLYRAVLLPFADSKGALRYVVGRISWRERAGAVLVQEIEREVLQAAAVLAFPNAFQAKRAS